MHNPLPSPEKKSQCATGQDAFRDTHVSFTYRSRSGQDGRVHYMLKNTITDVKVDKLRTVNVASGRWKCAEELLEIANPILGSNIEERTNVRRRRSVAIRALQMSSGSSTRRNRYTSMTLAMAVERFVYAVQSLRGQVRVRVFFFTRNGCCFDDDTTAIDRARIACTSVVSQNFFPIRWKRRNYHAPYEWKNRNRNKFKQQWRSTRSATAVYRGRRYPTCAVYNTYNVFYPLFGLFADSQRSHMSQSLLLFER